MVDEQIITDTIKRMLDSEIDEATIISTLKDIGMSEEQARMQIDKVKDTSPVEELDETESQIDQNQKLENVQNEVLSQAQKSELHETTTHNKLDVHEQKLDDVSKKVNEVHSSVMGSAEKSKDLEKPNNQKLLEVSAQQKAMMKLLNDIIDVNRKILTELQSKK